VENQCIVRDLGALELLVQALSSKQADTLKAAAWALLRASHQGMQHFIQFSCIYL